jgi:hypothetical protein
MIARYLAKRNNPWELLAIAALIFFPGLDMVLQTEPMVALPNTGRFRGFGMVLSPKGAHIFGWSAIAVAVFFVGLYFYARIAIARDEKAPVPHFLDLE